MIPTAEKFITTFNTDKMKETIYIIIRNSNKIARIEIRDDGVCVWEGSFGRGFESLSKALQDDRYKDWKLSHIETTLMGNYSFEK